MKHPSSPSSSQRKKSKDSIADHIQYRLREALFIFITALAIFLWLALLSYNPHDPGWSHDIKVPEVVNVGGRLGAFIADLMFCLLGYISFIFPFMLVYAAWMYWRDPSDSDPRMHYLMRLLKTLGFFLVIVNGAGLCDLYLPPSLPLRPGGIIGYVVTQYMKIGLNFDGTIIFQAALFLVGMTLFTGFSWLALIEHLGKVFLTGGHLFLSCCQWVRHQTLKGFVSDDSISPMIHKVQAPVLKDSSVKEDSGQPSDQKKARVLPKLSPKNTQSKDATHSVPSKPEKVADRPKLSLLDTPKNVLQGYSNTKLSEYSKQVEEKLADFGVSATVVAVHPGPVVTRFELQLAAGTKVGKVSVLAKDLARSLSVISVRVVEVIPGKSVIGLELPNEQREIVGLQEVLASYPYQKAHSALTLALGKDIAGHPVIVDLAKMPHLLVAGTTGSGKSVSLNTMLLSLLYKSSPEALRMILIDPKMLELSVYDGIAHLLVPVVTDMKEAASALRWCVAEMERRYQLMASLGVRNITGYNAQVEAAIKQGQPLRDPSQTQAPGQDVAFLEKLAEIVVLADEFADMMVVVGKKVETLIARLAQKARAAGIHLILATQRPSVDVITGLIKANIPTRIAFQVSSKIDSRTILDQQGAEQLLGHGDMLYLPPGSGVPIRVHGAYVSDHEVHRVVEYLKKTAPPQYREEILNESTQTQSTDPVIDAMFNDQAKEEAEQDEFYDQAVEMVIKSRRVSVSSIQRRFKIGYNRASRIVEAMELAGVVSAMETNGSRDVLVAAQEP